jgi:hypothetical protein
VLATTNLAWVYEVISVRLLMSEAFTYWLMLTVGTSLTGAPVAVDIQKEYVVIH